MRTRLVLFVAGRETTRSRRAMRNLDALVARLAAPVEVEVVDVLEELERADREAIIATPTLARTHPSPIGRVVGDLGDGELVARTLGLEVEVERRGSAGSATAGSEMAGSSPAGGGA